MHLISYMSAASEASRGLGNYRSEEKEGRWRRKRRRTRRPPVWGHDPGYRTPPPPPSLSLASPSDGDPHCAHTLNSCSLLPASLTTPPPPSPSVLCVSTCPLSPPPPLHCSTVHTSFNYHHLYHSTTVLVPLTIPATRAFHHHSEQAMNTPHHCCYSPPPIITTTPQPSSLFHHPPTTSGENYQCHLG
ncbi:hypothetical protein E2C01_051074 [Portunus trituberculatus]|uniref:Uncharacterized protein n=1 Tax=Portunus trituberculatus TaxID=210409 RepID=A0A5B7GA09_PORTR|nr:hypothetical protein [Portunus trituberculatus]